MSNLTRTILRHSLTFIVVVAGVAGGMYVGSAISGDKGYPTDAVQPVPEVDPRYQPQVAEGDLFPPISLSGTDPAPDLRDLVKGRRAMIIFVCGGCPSCSNLLNYWSKNVAGETAGPIDVVLVQSLPDKPLSSEQRSLLPSATVVTCDRDQAHDQFNIIVQPTMFAVDNQGFIQSVQVGFDDHFTPEMSDYLHQ